MNANSYHAKAGIDVDLPIASPSRRARLVAALVGGWQRLSYLIFLILSSVRTEGEEPELLSRIVAVGASVTDGFHLSEARAVFRRPRSVELALPRHVEVALGLEKGKVLSFGHRLLLANVEESGRLQLQLAQKAEPSVLIAVDFLFWYLYGYVDTEAQRLQRLERGLAALSQFDCPMIVGNFPNAASAVGHMINARQLPSKTTLAAANARLAKWVAERKTPTELVDLAEFMAQSNANAEVVIHGCAIAEGASRKLLQEDRLHPSLEGAALLGHAVAKCRIFAKKRPQR